MVSTLRYRTRTGEGSFTVKCGKDAYFGVAGRAWTVVAAQGQACIPMNQAPYISIEEGMQLAGVTRRCPVATAMQKMLESRGFETFRLAAREFLGTFQLPIISGTASCGEFILSDPALGVYCPKPFQKPLV